MEGIGTPEIHGVIHSEEEGDEVNGVVRMEVGDAVEIHLAEVQAQPGHRAKTAPSAVEKDQVGPEGKSETRRAAVDRGDTGTRAQNSEFHLKAGTALIRVKIRNSKFEARNNPE
jgi:hypothetical protein